SLAALRACFIEIAEPVTINPEGGGAGGSAGDAGTGAAGTTGGASATSGTGGASGVTGVGGSGACGGGCGPQCTSCDAVPNAMGACDSRAGACVISSCTKGFVDCDGDAGNGCEVNFGPVGILDEKSDGGGGSIALIPMLSGTPKITGNPLALTNWDAAKS